jgi:hypothetical protein
MLLSKPPLHPLPIPRYPRSRPAGRSAIADSSRFRSTRGYGVRREPLIKIKRPGGRLLCKRPNVAAAETKLGHKSVSLADFSGARRSLNLIRTPSRHEASRAQCACARVEVATEVVGSWGRRRRRRRRRRRWRW